MTGYSAGNIYSKSLDIYSSWMSSNFELPVDVHTEDTTLVANVLTAMKALDCCECYKVEVLKGGYIMVRGVLKPEVNEIDSDHMHLLLGVSPSRIERVLLHRPDHGRLDIVVRIMDHTHRVMVTGMATFVAVKKRRLSPD